MIEEHKIYSGQSQDLIDAAYLFAKKHHKGQYRKFTNEPYIVHPVRVAQTVASVTNDVNAISAAFLHDIIEDTDVSYDELSSVENGFGFCIADMVFHLTKIKKRGVSRKVTLDQYNIKLMQSSSLVQTIKLADILDNLPSIIKYDPEFAVKYVREKEQQVRCCVKSNITLYRKVELLIKEYYNGKI